MEALIQRIIFFAAIAGFTIWEFYQKNKLIRSGDVYSFELTSSQVNDEELARNLFFRLIDGGYYAIELNDKFEGVINNGSASYTKYLFTYRLGSGKKCKAQVILRKKIIR